MLAIVFVCSLNFCRNGNALPIPLSCCLASHTLFTARSVDGRTMVQNSQLSLKQISHTLYFLLIKDAKLDIKLKTWE